MRTMSPGQRHALIAAAALAPFLVYEAVEVAQGDDGWPYSRFLRLMPPELFLVGLVTFNAWFGPHILRRTAQAVAAVVERACDDMHDVPFEPEEN